MHNSDLNPSQPKQKKLLVGLLVLSVGAVIALGLYALQLNKQIDSLRPQTTGPALQALLDSAQQAPHTLSNPAITAIDPFQQMEAIRQQMDAMMGSVFGGAMPSVTGIAGLSAMPDNSLFGAAPFAGLGLHQPDISLRETETTLEIVITVPEGHEFELGTDVQEDKLTVTGAIRWQASANNAGFSGSRSGSSQFSRTIMLPDTVVPAGMVTEHRDDEIVISLPKA
ncbi:MAG: hypothetical protein Q7L07_19180 [Pseudohongiella sp.]|nr:hypothetical protein [Pseudohongiella sp.]